VWTAGQITGVSVCCIRAEEIGFSEAVALTAIDPGRWRDLQGGHGARGARLRLQWSPGNAQRSRLAAYSLAIRSMLSEDDVRSIWCPRPNKRVGLQSIGGRGRDVPRRPGGVPTAAIA